MNSRLYIGNLPYTVNDAQLAEHFGQAGAVVEAKVMVDKHTNRSKGFGFVEMSTPEEAQAAINMFHEQELDGRKLIVNEARPRETSGSAPMNM